MRRFLLVAVLASAGCQGLCGNKSTTANAPPCCPQPCVPVTQIPPVPGRPEVLVPVPPTQAVPTPVPPPQLNPNNSTPVPPPPPLPSGANYGPPSGPIASVEPPPIESGATLGSPFEPARRQSTSRKIVETKTDRSATIVPTSAVVTRSFGGGVSTGRRPDLDGLDALTAERVRTVVYLHAPNRNPEADRRTFTARGIRFIPLTVNADAPNAAVLKQFDTLVAEPSLRPLHVYDDDGVLTGLAWYIHYRKVDRLTDDAARVRAGRLGWADDAHGRATAALKASRAYVAATP